MFKNAVFQGGGVKGIAYVGALSAIEDAGIRFSSVAGTSAGAIIAALYAAGYKADELKSLLEETDFSKFVYHRPAHWLRLLWNKGLHPTKPIYSWIFKCLSDKGVKHFEDLKIDLTLVASDVSNRNFLLFSRQSHPKVLVAEAVTMSMSIPIFFQPYEFGKLTVVDGGLLSNYPAHLFLDKEFTLGFRLGSTTTSPVEPPKSKFSYLYALGMTMWEAHDRGRSIDTDGANAIYIDDHGIPTTKFELTKAEKDLLYLSGFGAASKFLQGLRSESYQPSDTVLKAFPSAPVELRAVIPAAVGSNDLIRVSISGLFRIKIDDEYLLVKGRRINQFQPVGGVFKMWPPARHHLKSLHVLDDDCIQIDDESRDDLRIRVPLISLSSFLQWYLEGKGREISAEREFREELLTTGILPAELFPNLRYGYVETKTVGVRNSVHFKCWELLIAEIFEVFLTDAQAAGLQETKKRLSDQYIWAREEQIRSRGYDPRTKTEPYKISDSAEWILG